MTNGRYVSAIQAATGHSEAMIESTLSTADKGVMPLKFPGSVQWDIWICYQAIRAYEKGEWVKYHD